MALKNNPVSRHAGFKYNEKGEKEKGQTSSKATRKLK
jgi:hypothetical protein